MAEPFMGEIRVFAFDFPPKGYAFCDGSLLPIMQQQALYSLLGVTYGGDGRSTFAIPDLKGRTPIHAKPDLGMPLGHKDGYEDVVLDQNTLPAHTHTCNASLKESGTGLPGANVQPAQIETMYAPASDLTPMSPYAVENAGNGHPHSNMEPSLAVNFCISLTGTYPPRT